MILNQVLPAEMAETEMMDSGDDSQMADDNDVIEPVSGVIHHDIIEAIHKEILSKSQHNVFGIGEGFTLEGIVHLDSRESHYRVKTEVVSGIGPIYAVKIVTITNPSPLFNIREFAGPSTNVSSINMVKNITNHFGGASGVLKPSQENENINSEFIKGKSREQEETQCNQEELKTKDSQLGEESVTSHVVKNRKGESENVPLDYSTKHVSVDLYDSPLEDNKDVMEPEITGTSARANALKNKVKEVMRGPVNYSWGGAAGFGFAVHKKKDGDVLNLFLCPYCVYCCVKRGELKKHHTAVHLDGKPYGCPFCPYRSTHKSTLRSHVMSRHTGERPFECPHCDYKASQKGLVDKHIMTKHTGEKPFKCPHCDFSSSHSSTVKTHVMFKHTGEKPYKCPHCDYRAVQRGHIIRHIKAVHSGEKPFKCPHCEYKACRMTNIKKHVMAIHTKEKPFKCPHCDFKSSHKGNLSSHLISKHTDIKPFPCPHCEYKSSCRTGLNRHLQKHTGVKKSMLQCHYCTYTSDRKDHMRTHVTYVHFKGRKTNVEQLSALTNSEEPISVKVSDENDPEKNSLEDVVNETRPVLSAACQYGALNMPSTSNPD